jgi:hypothetical protein
VSWSDLDAGHQASMSTRASTREWEGDKETRSSEAFLTLARRDVAVVQKIASIPVGERYRKGIKRERRTGLGRLVRSIQRN